MIMNVSGSQLVGCDRLGMLFIFFGMERIGQWVQVFGRIVNVGFVGKMKNYCYEGSEQEGVEQQVYCQGKVDVFGGY